MRSDVLFLPSCIMVLMKRWTTGELKTGSPPNGFFLWGPLRLISLSYYELFLCCFGFFRAVFGTAGFAVGYARAIERAAHDFIFDARHVFRTTAAHEYDAVLLEVVLFARNVNRDFLAIGKTYARFGAQGGVG